MKRISIVLVIVLWIVMGLSLKSAYGDQGKPSSNIDFDFDQDAGVSTNQLLEQAFVQTGGTFREYNVNGWGQIDFNYRTKDELERIAREAVLVFDLKESYNLFVNESMGIRQVKLEGTSQAMEEVTLTIQNALESAENSHFRTYLVLDIKSSSDFSGAFAASEKIHAFFKKYDTHPRISMMWTAAFPGKVSEAQRKAAVHGFMEKLDGRYVEGIMQDNLISVTGYSPLLHEGLNTGNGIINFNIALRYNAYADETSLWMGTPVLTIEY